MLVSNSSWLFHAEVADLNCSLFKVPLARVLDDRSAAFLQKESNLVQNVQSRSVMLRCRQSNADFNHAFAFISRSRSKSARLPRRFAEEVPQNGSPRW